MSDSRLTRRQFISRAGATAIALPLVGVGGSFAAEAKRPNFVFILTDDQRFDSKGCAGHPFVRTPHMDRIAREGARFTNAFTPIALCAPSRACFLTGKYAHSHGVKNNFTPFDDSQPTFPSVLQNAGYKTALVGKWHMGGQEGVRAGFDRWVSFKHQGAYRDQVLNIDGVKKPTNGYLTDILTDYAVDFLKQKRDSPFCLYLSHKAVHQPFVPATRHEKLFADAEITLPESVRDELLKVAFGVWDHIKNRGDHKAENWELDWVGFLPGKRESRRYVGDVIMNQNDVRAEGKYKDLVAYGGWSMDDHHPAGMLYTGAPTIFHPAPSPFGISYRCLYSRGIENLFCAGRNISVTHAALSATRVMATCATLGQAVGSAAAIAARDHLTPRGVYERRIGELQQQLMEDDAYLPWHARAVSDLTKRATLTASEGDPEPLRNGHDRPIGDADNGWTGALGGWVSYEFGKPERIREVRLMFDSDLQRPGHNQPCRYALDDENATVPKAMVKAFVVEAKTAAEGWEVVEQISDNHRRLVRVPVDVTTTAIRVKPKETWGAERAHLFGFDIR